MGFIHDDGEFSELVQITATDLHISASLVQKDYWVTHVLWSLVECGFEIWFKGGTSLSKGFGLTQRFSEDLDLKLEHPDLPPVESWKSEGKAAIVTRQAFFDRMLGLISIPGMEAAELAELRQRNHKGIVVAARYPLLFEDMPADMRPFIQLEIGDARVNPSEERPITSWVHEKLIGLDQHWDYTDNRPSGIRCVNALVTLIEKFDAIAKRFERDEMDAAGFVRHYEDAARIIENASDLALPGGVSVRQLAREMREMRQIAAIPSPTASCFRPTADDRWNALARASERIDSWFWGDRLSLADCCARIAQFIENEIV